MVRAPEKFETTELDYTIGLNVNKIKNGGNPDIISWHPWVQWHSRCELLSFTWASIILLEVIGTAVLHLCEFNAEISICTSGWLAMLTTARSPRTIIKLCSRLLSCKNFFKNSVSINSVFSKDVGWRTVDFCEWEDILFFEGTYISRLWSLVK